MGVLSLTFFSQVSTLPKGTHLHSCYLTTEWIATISPVTATISFMT